MFNPFQRSNREFFWLLVRRDLKVRYAGSTLGGIWNIIHPLMLITVYMTIFSSIMKSRLGSAGVAHYGELTYGVHLCAGLLPWLLFSDVLIRSVNVLIENGNFLQKVSFPPVILFLTVFFNSMLVNSVGYAVFIGILLMMGKVVPLTALAGLGVMALMGLSALGLGLFLSCLNVFFRDIGHSLTVVMQFLFWFNPIVYYKEQIFPTGGRPNAGWLEKMGQSLIRLNPLERFITASQHLFGLGETPQTRLDLLIILLFPLICLTLGYYLFQRILPEARDCL